MAEIYVPIDYSDVKSVIPPDEDILYSTLCQGSAAVMIGTKTRTTKWVTHVLFTSNGVAYNKPNLFKKKKPSELVYNKWHEIDSIVSLGRLGIGFAKMPMSFKLIQEENFESKEKFQDRSKLFIGKFRPLLIQKKEEWLAVAVNDPSIKKRQIKAVQKFLAKMKKLENKRIAKEAKGN